MNILRIVLVAIIGMSVFFNIGNVEAAKSNPVKLMAVQYGTFYSDPQFIQKASDKVDFVLMGGYDFPLALKLNDQGRAVYNRCYGENSYNVITFCVQMRWDTRNGMLWKKIVYSEAILDDGSKIELTGECDSEYKDVSENGMWQEIYDRIHQLGF